MREQRERQRTRVVERARWSRAPGPAPGGRARRAARPPRRRRCRCASPPSACRWCPTCRSSSPRPPRLRPRRRPAANRVARPASVVPLRAAGRARRRRTPARRGPSGADRAPTATSDACSASTSTTVASELSITYCISAALNRYETGTDVSPTLRLAWRVVITSSEFGPHHAMRSPRRAPSARQRVAEAVGEHLELGVRGGRRPPAPGLRRRSPRPCRRSRRACCVRTSMEGSVAYRHAPDSFRRATPRPECRW